MRTSLRRRARLPGWGLLVALFVGLLVAGSAQAQNVGFQVGRHEPTPAGEWSFMVDG